MPDPKQFQQLWVSRPLGTIDIMHECRDLLGPDERGKPRTAYVVVHRALVEMRDRLAAAGKKHRPAK